MLSFLCQCLREEAWLDCDDVLVDGERPMTQAKGDLEQVVYDLPSRTALEASKPATELEKA